MSYSGGALTYTRETISDLSTISDPTTVTTTITKTSADGSLATYIGPILVGLGGTWWGPPGTAPLCIWPFCLASGPPGPVLTGAGGGGSSGFTGAGTPSDPSDGSGGGTGVGTDGGTPDGTSGGNGEGTSTGTGGGDGDGGGEGGSTTSEGSNGEDGGDGSNGNPTPEACPGAGTKLRRSNSILRYIIDNRLMKRGEESIISTNPLKDAFNAFGSDRSGNSLASAALDGAENILTNKFPRQLANAYVTGLNGHYTLPQKLTVGTGDNTNTFGSGQRVFWQVRWDYDPVKGPHVNAQFDSSKFAYQLASSQFQTPKKPNPEIENQAAKVTMAKITDDMNTMAKYSKENNMAKQEPDFQEAGGEQNAISNLKEAWKAIANGPCT